MKFKHVKGLELQNRNMLMAPNFKLRALLAGKEVDLNKEEAEDLKRCCIIQPVQEQVKKKKVKKEKLILLEEE